MSAISCFAPSRTALVRVLAIGTLGGALFGEVRAAPLVLIDIGHTINSPGALSARGATEYSFNRALAILVEETLRAHAFRTTVVNLDGAMHDLTHRTAASGDADMFLSVHHDSVQPRCLSEWEVNGKQLQYSDRHHGFSLFVARTNPALRTSLKCASAIGLSLKNAGFEPSAHHADPYCGESRHFADESNGVYYFDELVVLKTARSPAVLLEAGVIVNRDEETKLGQEKVRRAIAEAVSAGLKFCLGHR